MLQKHVDLLGSQFLTTALLKGPRYRLSDQAAADVLSDLTPANVPNVLAKIQSVKTAPRHPPRAKSPFGSSFQ